MTFPGFLTGMFALLLAAAPAPKPVPTFEDTFDAATGQWQTTGGKWHVADGSFVSAARGHAMAGSPSWTDYSLHVRLRTDQPGRHSWECATVAFRFTPRENPHGGDYYYVLLHTKQNLELGKRVNGKQVKGGLAHVREVPPATDWNDLTITVKGRVIQVSVGGRLEIEVIDRDPIPSGGIALMNLGASTCRFDSVRVTPPSVVESSAPLTWPGHRYGFGQDRGESVTSAAPAESWPTYAGSNHRSGVSRGTVSFPLRLEWEHRPAHPPAPAWPEPGKELHRLPFDYAFQTAIGAGLVLYGSSSEHTVTALDVQTGALRWRFYTEGPVRFAPVLDKGRVFAASDDGCVYCLDATDGRLIWRFRGGPADQRCMGNGQMISRWPIRSGVLVSDGVVYCAAGMWSCDGVYVHALNADDGSVRWTNRTSGRRYMKMPHDYLEGISGLSPQGYLLLTRGVLIIPNGRAMPAGLDAKTGELMFCRNDASKLHHAGGAWNIATGGLIIGQRHPLHQDRSVKVGEAAPYPGEGLLAWTCDTGEQVLALAGRQIALVADGMLYATGDGKLTAVPTDIVHRKSGQFYASGRVDPDLPADHVHPGAWWRGTKYPWYPSQVVPIHPSPAAWEVDAGKVYVMIRVGDVLITGGRRDVSAFRVKTGARVWQADIEGQVRGLAFARGRLVISTTTGEIACFGPASRSGMKPPRRHTNAADPVPKPGPMARQILRTTGVSAGYGIQIGSEEEVECQLAANSGLTMYVFERDPDRVQGLRDSAARCGLYGPRISVHTSSEPGLPYADYCANLVVVEEIGSLALQEVPLREVYRVLRPFGGKAYLGCRGNHAAWRGRLVDSGVPKDEIALVDNAIILSRGALPGSGEWTHQFADAGRTSATSDTHVRLPLKMLWFGGPGPARMVSRHWRAPAPAFSQGRLFVAGERQVMAVDAYNGRELWSREIPGVARFPAKYRGASIVTDGAAVYAPSGATCVQLDAADGAALRTYDPPTQVASMPVRENPVQRARGGRSKATPVPNKAEWEFLAVVGDTLVGSVGVANKAMSWWPEAYPECPYVFAIDKRNGTHRWLYAAEESVDPNATAIRDGRVHLIDAVSRARGWREDRRGTAIRPRAFLKTLSLDSGKTLWARKLDPTLTMLWSAPGVLLASGGRQFEAMDPATGRTLWKKPIRGAFPVITTDRLYVFPFGYELRTGEPLTVEHPVTGRRVPFRMEHRGGCGTFSGCPGGLFLRSGAAGMIDLGRDSGMHWLGQVRSSCWLNMIPAGGMLLMPEGSSNCSCPYSYQTSLAMVPDERHESWSVFPHRGARNSELIQRVRLNLGAVGDHRDDEGNLWLAYPRPFRPGALSIPMTIRGQVAACRDDADLAGPPIPSPWLYTSRAEGVFTTRIELALKRPVPAHRCEDSPSIDGQLDDPCWRVARELPFRTDEQRIDDTASGLIAFDDDSLYIAFRQAARLKGDTRVPWTAKMRGKDAAVWHDDSINVRLKKVGKREGLYLSVSASGARFDARGGKGRVGVDPRWTGEWRSAVAATPERWSAELAVPWSTLKDVGIDRGNLQLYLENTNQTGVGPKRSHYRYRPYTRLWCFAHPFVDVAFTPLPDLPERSFTVRLHFIESESIQPGARVFDIRIQGQTVIETLDVVKEAGGPQQVLVREVGPFAASDSLTLELVPVRGRPPLLNALELRAIGAGH